MRTKKNFDEAVALAHDFLGSCMQGNATPQQVLAMLTEVGGACYTDSAPGAFLDQQVENGDPLVDELLLRCLVILEDDSPRRRPAPFTVGGTDESTRPVTPAERVGTQEHRVRVLLTLGTDPFTGRPPMWGRELTRLIALHADAFHVGRRRAAFIALLRARTPEFQDLLRRATGVTI